MVSAMACVANISGSTKPLLSMFAPICLPVQQVSCLPLPEMILFRAYRCQKGFHVQEVSHSMPPPSYSIMPDLENFYVLWDSLFQPRYLKQYNLHPYDKDTKSKEPWAADKNLQTYVDQLLNIDNFYNTKLPIGGEQQYRWTGKDEGECGILATSNIWKNSSFDKNMSNQTSENDLLNFPPDKVKIDKCDNSINSSSVARVSGRNHRSHLASTSSSRQSFSVSGAVENYYHPRVEGNAKYRASDGTFELSLFASQPFVFQTNASQGYASSSKGNLSNEQIIEKDKIHIGAYERFLDSSIVTQKISVLPKQSAQSEQPALAMVVDSAESK